MEIRIELRRLARFPELTLRRDGPHSDVRVVLDDVCDVFADTASLDFFVSGFGQPRWPVDVRTDLPIFLEQLPRALACARAGKAFTIDFYEQGIERAIHFEPVRLHYIARCDSRTTWRPSPPIETIEAAELYVMLREARECLLRSLQAIAPRVAMNPSLHSWARL